MPSPADFGPFTLVRLRELYAQVVVWCGPCRVGRMLNNDRIAAHPRAGEPVEVLLQDGVFRCAQCGTLAESVTANGWTSEFGKTQFGYWRRETAP